MSIYKSVNSLYRYIYRINAQVFFLLFKEKFTISCRQLNSSWLLISIGLICSFGHAFVWVMYYQGHKFNPDVLNSSSKQNKNPHLVCFTF